MIEGIFNMDLQRLGGKWRIIGEDIWHDGELLWNSKNESSLLSLFLPWHEKNQVDIFVDIIAIEGVLINGEKVVLYACQSGMPSHSSDGAKTLPISVKYIFWDLCVNNVDELIFDSVIVDFGDIIDWTEMCYFEYDVEKDSISWKNQSDKKLETKEFIIDVYSNQSAFRTSMTNMQHTLAQKVLFKFTAKENKTLECYMEEIDCFMNLISLGIQQNVGINELQYLHRNNKNAHFADKIIPKKISHDKKRVEIKNTMKWQYLFDFLELFNDEKIFENWFAKYKKLKPVIDLCTSGYKYTDIPAEMLFLNMTQALETYHSRSFGNSKSKYCAYIDNMINDIYIDNKNKKLMKLAEHWKSYLMPPADKDITNIPLKTRLRRLMFVDFNNFFYTPSGNPGSFIDRVVINRNYFTHYDPSKEKDVFSKQELHEAIYVLFDVVRFYILKEIGFDEKFCKDKIEVTQNRLRINNMLINSISNKSSK